MGLFSFLFPQHKKIRTTHEAEMFREVFREDYELFSRIEKSDDLKRFQELEEYVNSPEFKKRRKDIEQLSYKDSEYYTAEIQYKILLKSRKLRAYCLLRDAEELKGYLRVKASESYKEYVKLHVVVTSAGFDKKLHAVEYAEYCKVIKTPKIAALIRLEKNRKFKYYMELKDTSVPAEFEQLTAFVQSDDFKKNRSYLLDKHRYLTTDDYKLLCEYEELKKRPDFAKYLTLKSDPYFNSMRQWEQVFEDTFTGGKLDENRWITRYYAGDRLLNDTYGVGQDVQLFTKENVSFDNNCVCLNFRKESIIGKYWDSSFGLRERKFEYTSGMLNTAVSFRQRYGRFEAKVKLNRSLQLNQCFWMAGEVNVPHVDIVKCCTEGISCGNIYPCHSSLSRTHEVLKDIDLASDFYIFTLEWRADRLVWMVNDTVVKEVYENIPDVPMYIAFSIGSISPLSEKQLSGKMEIDWVKAYKLKN